MTARLVATDGTVLSLDVARWISEPPAEEHRVLAHCVPPVLDVGCGPGRHVVALAERGMVALGVDVSPAMVTIARVRGAPVLRRSIFEDIPRQGRWGSALLLDGNIGIGGDPAALLLRVGRMLRPGGRVLAEFAPAGERSRRLMVRVENGNEAGNYFPWAVASIAGAEGLAAATGFRPRAVWEEGRRWFATLVADRVGR